ncbi:DinB family protein [Niabella beijingensis]|uniref:DinB family protein n=1 Tax=Niabella beijingensis TaxID=2872700 RepID=UPI001CBCBF92|nr:DinB family protein [Niabella beijingensis]MBZ4191423.1 DinB family protein [Niabella beijingensis]
MENGSQLAGRFREVMLNGTWIANTNFKMLLSGITPEQATTPIGTLNTIALLTFHVRYYISGLNHAFEKGTLEISDRYSFDAPVLRGGDDWNALQEGLWEDAEQFAAFVEVMPAEKLDEIFIDKKYGTFRRNIEAMIEHGYYHLGQVSLIRKLLSGQ